MAWFIVVEFLKYIINENNQPKGDYTTLRNFPKHVEKILTRIVEGKVDNNSYNHTDFG